MEKLNALLTKRASLVRAIEAKENEVSDLKKELAGLDEGVMALYQSEGVTSVKIDGLGSFVMQTRYYVSIASETKEQGVAALKRHYPELVQETVNAQTLSAWWSEMKKAGSEIPPEIVQFVKEYQKSYMQWTRSKEKANA